MSDSPSIYTTSSSSQASLTGVELNLVRLNFNLTSNTKGLTVWNPRATLRLGYLLRDSEIAKAVRTTSLNFVEQAPQQTQVTPKTTAEMLVVYAQQMVDQERRIQSVEAKVEQIEQRSIDAAEELNQLPILPPESYTPQDIEFISRRVLELVYTAWDMQPFAQDMGYQGAPFVWNPERRAILRAELDAKYAKLYGLTRDELRYILDPSDVYGAEFPSETFRVLKNKEMKEYGEYRTQRLVLAAWDDL